MNYKMNRLLRVMLIICITILLSVHNLCAQEVWEELAEQLMDEDEKETLYSIVFFLYSRCCLFPATNDYYKRIHGTCMCIQRRYYSSCTVT